MNRTDLTAALAEEAGTSKAEAGHVILIFFDGMAVALRNGERIEIRGFCSFFVNKYKSDTGRNPKTGEKPCDIISTLQRQLFIAGILAHPPPNSTCDSGKWMTS